MIVLWCKGSDGMDKEWEKIHKNPPENWREVWNNRVSISRFDTRTQTEEYIVKHKEEKLSIDLHPKDGYVVYKNRIKQS